MAYHTRTSDNTATKKQYDDYIELETYDSDDERILAAILVDEEEEKAEEEEAEKQEANAR
jgi:hypothetical protein